MTPANERPKGEPVAVGEFGFQWYQKIEVQSVKSQYWNDTWDRNQPLWITVRFSAKQSYKGAKTHESHCDFFPFRRRSISM